MSEESCNTCRFQRGYRCHRRPPVYVTGDDEQYAHSAWPDVKPDSWCGEFEPTAELVKSEMVGQKVPTPDKEQ